MFKEVNPKEKKGQAMETVFYRCETCGFTHQVPSYWSGHAPEEEMELEHIDLKTKEFCPDQKLKLVKG